MKTLREIQNEVAKKWGFANYGHLFINLTCGNFPLAQGFFDDLIIEIQRQAQHKINKRVEDDYLNDNFDTTSIVNDNNLIR